MNEELVGQSQGLYQASQSAHVGDISTLADLLDRVEDLRQYGELHDLPQLVSPMAGMGNLIKQMIMEEVANPETSLEAIQQGIKVLAEGIEQDRFPEMAAYSAELRPDEASVTGQTERGAGGEQEAAPLEEAGGQAGAFAADQELLSEYLAEQRTRLEGIEGNLLVLEKENSEHDLAELRRGLHTIKGDSGFLGLSEIEQISHAAEDYLDNASFPFDMENLFAVKDWLSRAFSELAEQTELSHTSHAALKQVLVKLTGEAAPGKEPPAQADSGAPEQEAPQPAPGTENAPTFELVAEESLLADFISESKEHLDVASTQLLSLENDPENEEAINSVFRAFHTVKGIAGFLNLDEVQHLAHDTENLLDMVRREEIQLTPALIDLVFEALDWLIRLIGNVRTGLESNGLVNTEPELDSFLDRVRAAQEGQLASPVDQAPRVGDLLVSAGAVSKETLESVVEEAKIFQPDKKLGEVLVEKEIVSEEQVSEVLEKQKQRQDQLRGEDRRKQVEIKETLRVDYDRLEDMIDTIGELVLAEAMISQDDEIVEVKSENLGKKLYNLRQVSRKLQELGTTIRMVPISGTFQKMARLVRDLSRKSGKPVNFKSVGDETELDRAYVDLIADPLVHMIRNAMDHGIEMPEERIKGGKPESGNIALSAYHEGGNIHVEVVDDGKGMDPEVIFNKAVEKGVVGEEEKMTEQEIFHLIFRPGFSTAAEVTEVSGRGVGMDVVRRNIHELRGHIQITSVKGEGTTFKLVLPLTLALIDGMLVRVGQERFIFPVLSVVESTRPTPEMVNTVVGKGEMISIRNRQLPLYRLYRLFGVREASQDLNNCLVVVVENDGRQVGVMVDDLVGIQQTVIKPLGSGLFESNGLSGGSIMPDGTVGLIVDVSGLINIARNQPTALSEHVN